MKPSLRSATLTFAVTVLAALSATAAALMPDDAGQVADMAAGLHVDPTLFLGGTGR